MQVFDNVGHVCVLAEGTDRYTMGAVADEVLDNYIGAVRLEGDAVCLIRQRPELNLGLCLPSVLSMLESWMTTRLER